MMFHHATRLHEHRDFVNGTVADQRSPGLAPDDVLSFSRDRHDRGIRVARYGPGQDRRICHARSGQSVHTRLRALSVAPGSAARPTAGPGKATGRSDDEGNTRLAKRRRNDEARDDAGAALPLAVGGPIRLPKR